MSTTNKDDSRGPQVTTDATAGAFFDLARRLSAVGADDERIREAFYTGLPETALSQPTPDAAKTVAAAFLPKIADAPPSNSEAAFLLAQAFLMLPEDGPEQLFVMAATVAAYERWQSRQEREA